VTKHKHLHPETQPQSDVKNAESTSQAEVRPQASDAKSQAAAPNAAEVEITKIREELNAA